MKILKTVFVVLFITVTFFLAADFIITAMGLDVITRLQKAKIEPHRRAHPFYHHDLSPNKNVMVAWGVNAHQLCTDQNGFKISCSPIRPQNEKHFDMAFIGDSFTEAVGMSYENSFVGLYASKHPEYSVANLGVVSYSPTIYLKKMEFFLKKGFTFNHLIVLPDISDIQDEAVYYDIDPDTGAVEDKWMVRKKARAKEQNGNKNNSEYENKKDFPPPHMALPDRKRDNIWEKHFKNIWYVNLRLHAFFHPVLSPVEDFDLMHNRSYWTTDLNVPEFGPGGAPEGIRQAVERMSELKKLMDEHNIKMSVVVYPWPSQLINNGPDHPGARIWKEFCEREHCANFVDVNGFFFDEVKKYGLKETLNKYYLDGDVHFGREGNRVMFEAIDKNLVP